MPTRSQESGTGYLQVKEEHRDRSQPCTLVCTVRAPVASARIVRSPRPDDTVSNSTGENDSVLTRRIKSLRDETRATAPILPRVQDEPAEQDTHLPDALWHECALLQVIVESGSRRSTA